MNDTAIVTPDTYRERIRSALRNCLVETALYPQGKRRGKVRDQYDLGDRVVLVTTDRQSAFDRVLAAIPFKGQVLNLTSAWWFEQTAHLLPNHVLAVPDPNVTVARKCDVFPIEFVVRGYVTGTTSTALWTVYKNGAREYCGNALPEGLVKNQRLPAAIITPTTKEAQHDRPIAPREIVSEGWMTERDWARCRDAALALFAFGQQKAAEHGLILVDTKYEMGRDADGRILLIDELHTPDSSRYWLADSYAARLAAGLEPENVDKEFLRLWFVEHCDPYHDAELPPAPDDLVIELSRRYIFLYEKITGRPFAFPDARVPVAERIARNLAGVA
jgi:phosphoribosylaminoimidazole-succinocarboxamide synthase